MEGASTSPLIETEEVAALIGKPGVKILFSVYNPGKPDEVAETFQKEHLPGAVLFNADVIRDKTKPYPFMLPSEADFIEAMKGLGVSHTDTVIVYDNMGVFASPRTWWMLSVMGATNVRVMNGGLPKWKAEKRQLENGKAKVTESTGDFNYKFNPDLYATFEQVQEWRAAPAKETKLIEARPGVEEEGKHIPGSTFIPFPTLLSVTEEGVKTMKAPADLKSIFSDNGVDPAKGRPIFTCGAAITACVDALGFECAFGVNTYKVYDGSFSEWKARNE